MAASSLQYFAPESNAYHNLLYSSHTTRHNPQSSAVCGRHKHTHQHSGAWKQSVCLYRPGFEQLDEFWSDRNISRCQWLMYRPSPTSISTLFKYLKLFTVPGLPSTLGKSVIIQQSYLCYTCVIWTNHWLQIFKTWLNILVNTYYGYGFSFLPLTL